MFKRKNQFIAPAAGIASSQSIDSLNKQLEELERKNLQMPELNDLKQSILKLRREIDDLLKANLGEKQHFRRKIADLSAQLADLTEKQVLWDACHTIETYLNNNQPQEAALIALNYPTDKIELLINVLKPFIKNPKLSSTVIAWLTHMLPENNDLFWLCYVTCAELMENFNEHAKKNIELSSIYEVLFFMQEPKSTQLMSEHTYNIVGRYFQSPRFLDFFSPTFAGKGWLDVLQQDPRFVYTVLNALPKPFAEPVVRSLLYSNDTQVQQQEIVLPSEFLILLCKINDNYCTEIFRFLCMYWSQCRTDDNLINAWCHIGQDNTRHYGYQTSALSYIVINEKILPEFNIFLEVRLELIKYEDFKRAILYVNHGNQNIGVPANSPFMNLIKQSHRSNGARRLITLVLKELPNIKDSTEFKLMMDIVKAQYHNQYARVCDLINSAGQLSSSSLDIGVLQSHSLSQTLFRTGETIMQATEEVASLKILLVNSLNALKQVALNDPGVFVIGPTRSGKSTFINYILENDLKWESLTETIAGRIVPKARRLIRKDSTAIGPEIGHEQSKTLFPRAYFIPTIDLPVIDTAGFGDTRGVIHALAAKLVVQSAIQSTKGANLLIYVAETAWFDIENGKRFSDWLRGIVHSFAGGVQDYLHYKDNIIFVFSNKNEKQTVTEEELLDKIFLSVDTFILQDSGMSETNRHLYLNLLNTMSGNLILLGDLTTENSSREKIITRIRENRRKERFIVPEKFKFSISDEEGRILLGMAGPIASRFKEQQKELRQKDSELDSINGEIVELESRIQTRAQNFNKKKDDIMRDNQSNLHRLDSDILTKKSDLANKQRQQSELKQSLDNLKRRKRQAQQAWEEVDGPSVTQSRELSDINAQIEAQRSAEQQLRSPRDFSTLSMQVRRSNNDSITISWDDRLQLSGEKSWTTKLVGKTNTEVVRMFSEKSCDMTVQYVTRNMLLDRATDELVFFDRLFGYAAAWGSCNTDEKVMPTLLQKSNTVQQQIQASKQTFAAALERWRQDINLAQNELTTLENRKLQYINANMANDNQQANQKMAALQLLVSEEQTISARHFAVENEVSRLNAEVSADKRVKDEIISKQKGQIEQLEKTKEEEDKFDQDKIRNLHREKANLDSECVCLKNGLTVGEYEMLFRLIDTGALQQQKDMLEFRSGYLSQIGRLGGNTNANAIATSGRVHAPGSSNIPTVNDFGNVYRNEFGGMQHGTTASSTNNSDLPQNRSNQPGPQDNVLVLGGADSGKKTIIEYLKGARFTLKVDESTGDKVLKKLGDNSQSTAVYNYMIQTIDAAQLRFLQTTQFKSILVIVEEEELGMGRGTGFVEKLRIIEPVIKNINACVFVFNKTDKSPTKIIHKVKGLLSGSMSLQITESNVLIVHPEDQGETRLLISQAIASSPVITLASSDGRQTNPPPGNSRTQASGNIEVNTAYEYEDNDINAILSALVLQSLRQRPVISDLLRIQVLSAVHGNTPNQLEQQIRLNRSNYPDGRVLLIPYNVSGYHWLGLLLEFNADGTIKRAEYMNSMGDQDFDELQYRLRALYPSCSLTKRPGILRQEDDTSCGAYTIENLLWAAMNSLYYTQVPTTAIEIRSKHLGCLKSFRPDFYSEFNIRQRENQRQNFLNYCPSKETVFNVYEQRQIIEVTNSIKNISNEKFKVLLSQAFQPHDDYTDNRRLHLNHIRNCIRQVASNLTSSMPESVRVPFQNIVRSLFGMEWSVGVVLSDSHLDKFLVNYAQIEEISKQLVHDQNQQSQHNVDKQIQADQALAEKLQRSFYEELNKMFEVSQSGTSQGLGQSQNPSALLSSSSIYMFSGIPSFLTNTDPGDLCLEAMQEMVDNRSSNPAPHTIDNGLLITQEGSKIPVQANKKINPYKVSYEHNTKHKTSSQQAQQMLADFMAILQNNPEAKIAVTYSANNDQAKNIIAGYNTGNYAVCGANQAAVFSIVIEEIKRRQLQDQIHVLPVTTCEHAGGSGTLTREHINRDMQNIARHAGADWIILGLQNQTCKINQYAIGGGIVTGWSNSALGQIVTSTMQDMTNGDFNDPLLKKAYDEGAQNPTTLLITKAVVTNKFNKLCI